MPQDSKTRLTPPEAPAPAAPAAGAPATRSAARNPGETGLEAELAGFVAQLRLAQAADQARRDAPAGDQAQRLLYILGPEDLSPQRVELRLVSARSSAGGRYAGGQRFTQIREALIQPPAYFDPQDLRILRALLLDGDFAADGTYRFSGKTAAAALSEMVATGRCHWDSVSSPALSAGAPREARIEWVADEAGEQSVRFSGEQTISAIIASTPLWYVDAERRLAGELHTGLGNALTLALAGAPSVPPLQADAMRSALHAQLGEVPLPAAIPVEEEVRAAPVARITLYSDVHAARWLGRGLGGMDMLHYAKLSFDYLGLIADSRSPSVLVGYSGGRIRHIRRDPRAERTALDRLRQEQFVGLHELGSNMSLPSKLNEALTLPSEEHWLRFMLRINRLRGEGWQIRMDPSFSFEIEQAQSWTGTVEMRGDQWFEIELGIEIAGERISLIPLLPAIMAAASSGPRRESILVRRPNGKMLVLPRERIERILGVFTELSELAGPPEGARSARTALPEGLIAAGDRLRLHRLDSARLTALGDIELNWGRNEQLRRLAERLSRFNGITPVDPPRGLQATLRPYQLSGLAWLQFMRELGCGGVLADDMGLGKTMQTLAHLLLEKEAGRLDRPALVVAPTSVIHNWIAERERFAPALRMLVLHGSQRKQHYSALGDYDLVLTTYPLLSRDRKHLAMFEFSVIVLDESQNVKNATTLAARALTELRAGHRLCLTGTPLENHLGELWSLFRFLMPGFLGEEAQFRRIYRNPIEKLGDDGRRQQLVQRIRPFILRRTKEMVASELPPKTEIIQRIEMSGAQRDLYETVRMSVDRSLRERLAQHGLAGSQIVLLDALLKLRQTCCDPRLVRLSGARGVTESAKLGALMERLPELIEEGRRILVFSQFAEMIKLIAAALTTARISFVTLTGETVDRKTPISRFQAGEVPVFLISLKAGGVGLNLTAADTVVHYDPWWNPAVERQATDRAHRIGQDKPVFVYKLIAAGSVEERILELQERKAALASAILEGGDLASGSISREDIDVLLSPLA
jgi:hypothetical protein